MPDARANGLKAKSNGSYSHPPYQHQHSPQMSLTSNGGQHPMIRGGFVINNAGWLITVISMIVVGISTVAVFWSKAQDTQAEVALLRRDVGDIKIFIGRQDEVNRGLANSLSDIRNDVRSLVRDGK